MTAAARVVALGMMKIHERVALEWPASRGLVLGPHPLDSNQVPGRCQDSCWRGGIDRGTALPRRQVTCFDPTFNEGLVMTDTRTRRILVVTDHAEPTMDLMNALVRRSENDDVQFRLIVLNPARAEVHLLHPERHDKAAQAEQALHRVLPRIQAATHADVVGSVSVRNDPMDAIEAALADEPVDEIMLAVPPHRLSSWLHQDLPHRLTHWGLPVQTVATTTDQSSSLD